MTKNIMVQGTGSSVGKSMLTAALCRIFLEDGYRVAPFKSQNMALNSFVTSEGLEMGRAQVVQAEACNLEPSVLMNPILLKPTSNRVAQVIVNGKVYKNLDASRYHSYKKEAKAIVTDAYSKLASEYDVIILEGAGSPAEINLRENDIVNMGMAEIADAPVILVADIDRGGVFASIVGTLFLLEEHEKKRVKGVIINKFRGDFALLKPGIEMLEEIIKIPVLGVMPYLDICLDEEDSVSEKLHKRSRGKKSIAIEVIKLPHISNFTDFNVFELFEDVQVNYVSSPGEIDNPDMLVLPGSKNTIADYIALRDKGFIPKIHELAQGGVIIVGMCAGFQMLGTVIEDPMNIESDVTKINGLDLIPMCTVLQEKKITKQVTGSIIARNSILDDIAGLPVKGYEIHMGYSSGEILDTHALVATEDGSRGIIMDNILGTYIHGIFDNLSFTKKLLDYIREKKGLAAITTLPDTIETTKQKEFSRLAAITRAHLDMKKIYNILEKKDVVCK